MALIDTSAWIEFLRKSGDVSVKAWVEQLLVVQAAAYTCPVRFELLAGTRDSECGMVEEALSYARHHVFEARDWEMAATTYRELRNLGVTVPRDDVLIATVARRLQLPILCRDRHFDIINQRAALGLIVKQV